jgi:hypothetical protein
MDKLKVLEEIAKTGCCSTMVDCSPCDTCPIGNACINGTLVIVDCWEIVIGDKEKMSTEEINNAYKKEATRLLIELLIEEVLNEKGEQ